VLGEPCDHQLDLHLGKDPRRDTGARFQQHLEPDTEPIRVELFVQAGPASAPQIKIQDAGQLVRRRQRDQLAALCESIALNDAMKHLGAQSREHLGEMRHVENAIEQTMRLSEMLLRMTVTVPFRAVRGAGASASRIRATATGARHGFRHGPAMIQAPPPNKQS
jgi:hypothetical protein